MNKQWIEDSHLSAERCRNEYWLDDLDGFDHLDMVGLYETCWLITDFNGHTEHDKNHYGYPSNEQTMD